MCFLSICASEISCKSNRNLRIFTVRIHTDCFRTGEGFHLFLLAVDGDGRKLYNTVIITECLFNCGCIPGTGEHCFYRTVTQTGKTGSVCIRYEVRIVYQVNQVIGHCFCFIAFEVNACCLVCSVLTEQRTAVCYVEGSNVPGVCNREGNLVFCDHGIQVFHFILSECRFIIVHKPGVCGEWYTVDIAVNGYGIYNCLRVVLFYLLNCLSAEF